MLVTEPIYKENTSNIIFSRSDELDEIPSGWGEFIDPIAGYSVYYPLGWGINTSSPMGDGLIFTKRKTLPEVECGFDEEATYSISIYNTKDDTHTKDVLDGLGGKEIILNGIKGTRVDSYPTAPWLVGPVYLFEYNHTETISFKFIQLCLLNEEATQLQEDFENIFLKSFKSLD